MSYIEKGLYRHFKGNYYLVMDVVTDSESQEPMVVYRALYGDKGVWVRPLSMFSEVIERDGIEQARFSRCEEQTCVLEVAIIDIEIGRQKGFEQAFEQASKLIASLDGYISHELKVCVEQENRYLLLVEWQTLEAHTVGFRESDQYQRWRDLLHGFFVKQPSVLHYQANGID